MVESGWKKWAGGEDLPLLLLRGGNIPLRTERMHCTAALPAATRDGCPYPLGVRSAGQVSIVSLTLFEGTLNDVSIISAVLSKIL